MDSISKISFDDRSSRSTENGKEKLVPMTAKSTFFVSGIGLLLMGICGLLVSCQEPQQGDGIAAFETDEVFGNGFADNSPVICRVGDLEITQSDLDLRHEELPRSLKARFSGPDWEKQFLRYMVEEVLLYKEALKRKLYLQPEVSQQLISQRRSVLKSALRSYELVKDLSPTEEQIQTYYERNRERYNRQGTLHARHVACKDKETAYEAYDRLRQGGKLGHFARVVADVANRHQQWLDTTCVCADYTWRILFPDENPLSFHTR